MATSPAALEELYRARFGVFRDGLAGVVSSREIARGVVQEAFARALRDRKKSGLSVVGYDASNRAIARHVIPKPTDQSGLYRARSQSCSATA
ncbi:MAG TPA: hypothetical protein VH210_08135 [Gaiellaceae bacterium]|jgi:DNA-directed RNA polymerase specialized sigma24 family protein|nr:hypothetical protein [Gaiellaceae bacterium]